MTQEILQTAPLSRADLSHVLIADDPKVRMKGVVAFLSRPDLLGECFHLVVDDPNPEIRRLLLKVAVIFQGTIPREALEQLLITELSSHVHLRRYMAVGALNLISGLDIGHLLARSAKDSQIANRKAVLQTMRARLKDIAEKDVEKIIGAQCMSADWRHRLLGMSYLEADKRIQPARYLCQCAGEKQPHVRRAMFHLVKASAVTFSDTEVKTFFTPEIVAEEWRARMAAVMLLRTLKHSSAKSLLAQCTSDSVLSVRETARRALESPSTPIP